MQRMNDTHDPALESWVETANHADCDFPIQNLPFGIFRRTGAEEPPRGGVAIGDCILDLTACQAANLFAGTAATAAAACAGPTLNPLMALGAGAWTALRARVSELLRDDGDGSETVRGLGDGALVPMAEADLFVPAAVGDFTDFWASVHHATNAGSIFRPESPLLPNYKHLPIGYHGRVSSIVVSGTGVRRPIGQTRNADGPQPNFGPCRALDYELETGFYVGPGNALGAPVNLADADAHIFGLCLLNDWSARDFHAWEAQPLGPLLGKNFATTVSPWIVTLEALAPFRTAAFRRPDGDPAPLPYLLTDEDQSEGGLDIQLEVALQSKRMRAAGTAPHVLGRSEFRNMYWTVAQMLSHHTSNGCNLRPGDLMGSGTVSGATDESYGSLLELTRGGQQSYELPSGETQKYIEDGDEVYLRGRCSADGFTSIGFGECRGEIVAASE